MKALILLIALASCTSPNGVGNSSDYDKIISSSEFENIPESARDIKSHVLNFQSHREFMSFYDTTVNIDNFIKSNTSGLKQGYRAFSPKLSERWWITSENMANRKYFYTREPCEFVDILIKDENKMSRIWIVKSTGC